MQQLLLDIMLTKNIDNFIKNLIDDIYKVYDEFKPSDTSNPMVNQYFNTIKQNMKNLSNNKILDEASEVELNIRERIIYSLKELYIFIEVEDSLYYIKDNSERSKISKYINNFYKKINKYYIKLVSLLKEREKYYPNENAYNIFGNK